jgi:glutamyl-tRNA(Gln) amidotransferase subunit D
MNKFNFIAGDSVVLRLAEEEIKGIVLECSDGEIVLLKLENGYNIGIPKINILGSRILKKFVDEKGNENENLSLNKGLSNIGLIVTGGTIASKLDAKTGGVKHLTEISEFRKFYPELFKSVNVKRLEIPFMVASESMNFEHWAKISEICCDMLNDKEIKGIIITHGTDFLHYTSSALSFMLKNLNKPVVLTYSQRSIDRASSDANLNLQCAVKMALSDCAEVMLVGHATVNDDYCYALKGVNVRKMHSSRRDAFKPVNLSPLAKVWKDKIEFSDKYNLRNENKKVELDNAYSDKIGLVKFYPGQDSSILDFYALKYKGIIIEASGLGHLPVSESKESWIPRLKKHIRNGFVVCVCSQTIFGKVDPYVYSNGRELLDAGVIFLENMISETAFVKLGWILGHYGWKNKIEEKMLENLSGEINKKLDFEKFI